MPSSKNKHHRCSVCLTETESLFYVCKSGRHVICKNCQRLDNTKHRHDDGDHKTEKECTRSGNKKEILFSKNAEKDFLHLASGDHFNSVEKKSAFKITISNEVTKKKCRLSTSTPKVSINAKHTYGVTLKMRFIKKKDHVSKCDFAVMVNIENQKYLEAKSTETGKCLDIKPSENLTIESPIKMIEDRTCEQDPRPVTCPVTECSRMVTIESFSQHFYFDHSKVPRIMFDNNGLQEIYVNYSTLSTEAKCLAIFIITPKRSIRPIVGIEETPTILHNLCKDGNVILLMASKILTISTKLFNLNCDSRMSHKNSYSQTEEMQITDFQPNRQGSKCSSRNLTKTIKSCYSNEEDEDMTVLLWLCKFDDKDRIYTIMATREDEKQGYSYTGDAVSIRKEHNPYSIYSLAECLSINKTAVNKLITPKNEFKVLIRSVL